MAEKNLRIGLIGIGNMGNPMGANLIKVGWNVTVYDTDAGKIRAFTAAHGGVKGAVAATMSIMIGGDPALAERLDALLACCMNARKIRLALMPTRGEGIFCNTFIGIF